MSGCPIKYWGKEHCSVVNNQGSHFIEEIMQRYRAWIGDHAYFLWEKMTKNASNDNKCMA